MGRAVRATAPFAGLELLFWASIASVEAFLVPYLHVHGYSAVQSGAVMSSLFLLAIAGAPLWGYVCDRNGRYRPTVVAAMVIGSAAIVVLPLMVYRFPVVLVLALLFSASVNSQASILDSWIMKERSLNSAVEYGLARGMGSFGYAAMAVGAGALYDRVGLGAIFPLFALFAGAVIFTALRVSDRPIQHVTPSAADAVRPNVVRTVIANRPYLVVLVAGTLLFIPFRATQTFLPLLILDLGGRNTQIGLAQSIGAASEMPFLLFAGYAASRLGPRRVLTVTMVLFVIRMSLYPLAPTVGWIFVLQLFHGLTFGVFLGASVYYIDHIAPPGRKTLFQTLAPAAYFGVGSVVGNALGGAVIEAFGIRTLYAAAPVVMACAALLFILGRDHGSRVEPPT